MKRIFTEEERKNWENRKERGLGANARSIIHLTENVDLSNQGVKNLSGCQRSYTKQRGEKQSTTKRN